jgi:hypothetical protein
MRTSILALVTFAVTAADLTHPSGHRTTPPTLNSVVPLGLARGTTTELTVEGLNLAKASAIYFSEPGVTGRILRVKELPDLPDIRLGSNGTPSTIDLGPLPPRNQVTIDVDVSPDAEIGPVSFRLQTPLGTSPEGRFLIEPYYGETPDKEPNDTAENAIETFLPTILTGAISKPGDLDYYKIKVKAGEQLVFENAAMLIGSALQPVVSILTEDDRLIREYGADGGPATQQFACKFEKAGTYYIRVADFQNSGRAANFYRIKVGKFPLITGAYPLGLQLGHPREIALEGYNLNPPRINILDFSTSRLPDFLPVRPQHSFNELKLALGSEPEIEALSASAQPQAVTVPVTINGRLSGESYFRFHARKDQKLILEVNARRLGSELDSFLEVLDANSKPIERATVRPVSETFVTLSDRDSSTRGIRLQSWNDWKPGDYIMIGGEIIRVETLPNGPDEDVLFTAFGGQRIAYLDTSTEAHAVDKPAYKVRIHPPGAKFPPNGLPLVRLYYQNDDGGPGYGKDSLVHFTAPADGDYLVHLRDTRGSTSNAPYRLTIREPRSDFRLTATPRNPNVPVGGTIPVTVTAFRMDDFDGEIRVSIAGLPPGLKSTDGVIAPGQVNTTLIISADATAKLEQAAPLNIIGRAGALERQANPDDQLSLVSLMPKPDVVMTAETKVVEIEPGKQAQITVSVERENDFHGRVPVAVMNLPPGVKVIDVGLNGVLITEQENRRSFTIEALPSAEPIEQMVYVGGVVETRSNLPSTYAAPQPILLRIRATQVSRPVALNK